MQSQFRWFKALILGAMLAGAFGVTVTVSPPAVAATPSRGVAKQLKAALDDIRARKYDAAFAKLKEAEAFPKKTALDQHLINDLSARAYLGKRDYNQAMKYFEAELGDGVTSGAEEQKLVKYLATLAYSIRNYDKTIDFGNRAIKGGYADNAIYTAVGQAYYQKGDWHGTRKFEEEQIAAQTRHGEPAKPESLELLLTACQRLNDETCQTHAFEQLVQYKPQYWQNLLYNLQKGTLNDHTQLQLYRLMLEVNVLKHPEEYTEMAQLALEQGAPGEAEQVIQKGFENKVFTDQRLQDKNHRLLAAAKKAAAADMAKLPQRQQQADAAPTGEADVKVGYDYLGYQQYDKAAAEISKGLAKGGVSDPASARILLGIAQLKAGHKDDAIKTFHSVKGSGDDLLPRLASLWALRAKQPSSVARR